MKNTPFYAAAIVIPLAVFVVVQAMGVSGGTQTQERCVGGVVVHEAWQSEYNAALIGCLSQTPFKDGRPSFAGSVCFAWAEEQTTGHRKGCR